MKKTNAVIVIALFASLLSSKATDVTIPSGDFNNVSGTVRPPLLLGTTTASLGAWTATISGVLNLGGSIKAGTAASLNAPLPPDGTYELDINLPANVAVSTSLSETLTNQLIPNSVYTLSVNLDQGAVLNLITKATLSLNAGSTTLAALTGADLATILNTGTNYQTVALTYKTGNTVPTNGINIKFSTAGLTTLAGDIYLNGFQLVANPIQIQLNPTLDVPSNGSLSLSGSGGAPNATYQIVSSTNLLSPTATWISVTTNKFDANGNFNTTFKVDPNTPRRFFKVMLP